MDEKNELPYNNDCHIETFCTYSVFVESLPKSNFNIYGGFTSDM